MVNYPHKVSSRNSLKFPKKKSVDFANRGMSFEKMINETNLKHLYQMMKKQEQYFIKQLTFDDLNEVAENFSEN